MAGGDPFGRGGGGTAAASPKSSDPFGRGAGGGGGGAGNGGGGVLGVLGHVAHVVAQKAELAGSDIKNIPGGTIDFLNKGVVQPWKDVVTTGHVSAKHNAAIDNLISQTADSTQQTLTHPFKDPFQTLLLAGGPALHGVGVVAERAGAAGAAARAGEGIGGIAKAVATKPEVSPRLIDLGGSEPVSLHASKNPGVRLVQRIHDTLTQRAAAANPEGPAAGYLSKRAGGALDETARYQQRMREAPATALDQAAKNLTSKTSPGTGRVNQAALELTSVNTAPEVASAYHLGQAEKGIDAARNRVVAKLYDTVAQKNLLTKNENGDVIVNAAAHPDLAKADLKLARVQGRGDEILARYGIRSPEQLQEAVNAPGRYRAGAKYVTPTPARQGVESPALTAAKAERDRLATLHGRALDQEASHLTAAKSRDLGPLSEADARTRLAQLDAWHDRMLERVAPEVNPYGSEDAAAETRSRNTMRGRMAAGKKATTGRVVEGKMTMPPARIATVNQEVRDLAEKALRDTIARNPNERAVRTAGDLLDERDRLRAALNARAEAAFGGEQAAAMPRAAAEKHASVPPAANQYRDRIVTLGHALEQAQAKVDRLQGAADRRVEPTGIIGGETARPGRGHVSYASSEKRAPRTPAAASSGAVVGEARTPITSHANTGFNIEHGQVPKDVTRGASRKFRAVTRFENTTLRRDQAVRAGAHADRQSERDVLVKLPGVEHGQLSQAVEQALGKERPTVDELNGLNAALDQYRQQLVPGLADRFAGDVAHPIGQSAEEAAAQRGLDAPKGYVWVDRNLLGDLGKPSPMPRNKFMRGSDTINSAVTAATVYFKIGHVGTRVLTNASTNLIQGSLNPVAIGKSLHLWRTLTDEEKARALAAAGQHGFAAMPQEVGAGVVGHAVGVAAHGGAQWWARHADAPFRFNSIAYEARKAGFDNPAKFREFLHQLETGETSDGARLNAAQAAKVDWVAKRANRAQIAYDRLNRFERDYLARGIWFYPWVKGSTMFLGHTVIEHPYKAAALAAAGKEGQQAQASELGALPSYEQGLFRLAGGADPLVADFSTFSPFATPADLLDTLARPGEASGQLNPVLGSGVQLTTGLNAFGQKSKSPISDAIANLFSPTPEAQILTGFRNRGKDQSRRMFPASPALSGTLSPLLRALIGPGTPRRINLAAAHSNAAREKAGR